MMMICLERVADLHIAQLMPLPLTVSCFSKIQIGFTFLVPAHPGSPRQRAVKWVCVYIDKPYTISTSRSVMLAGAVLAGSEQSRPLIPSRSSFDDVPITWNISPTAGFGRSSSFCFDSVSIMSPTNHTQLPTISSCYLTMLINPVKIFISRLTFISYHYIY